MLVSSTRKKIEEYKVYCRVFTGEVEIAVSEPLREGRPVDPLGAQYVPLLNLRPRFELQKEVVDHTSGKE